MTQERRETARRKQAEGPKRGTEHQKKDRRRIFTKALEKAAPEAKKGSQRST